MTGDPSYHRTVPESDAVLANAPRRRSFRIDEVLVEYLQPGPGDVVMDLGCGSGFTLATAAKMAPELVLLGIDRDVAALEAAASLLEPLGTRFLLIRANLGDRLPLADGSIPWLVCHNVLEQLADPGGLVAEAARVLRPGGRSVWSHPDYDSVVISGADAALTRRIVHYFADLADPTMDHADGQMGRKLAGLVQHSPLVMGTVGCEVLVSTRLAGPARFRVKATVSALRRAAQAGKVDLTVEELDSWKTSLETADKNGEFLYSHNTYVVVADKGGGA